MTFLDEIRSALLADGVTTKPMLDYIDDRIKQIVDDRLSQSLCEIEERLLEEVRSTKPGR